VVLSAATLARVNTFLLVCTGGALGSGLRYLVDHGTTQWMLRERASTFPWGTLAVNVVGSFLLAFLLTARTSTGDGLPAAWRFGLGTGLLGGFTTYSTFNVETLYYLQNGKILLAAGNVALTLTVCLLAGLAGAMLARTVLP
jgi:CrcB protein